MKKFFLNSIQFGLLFSSLVAVSFCILLLRTKSRAVFTIDKHTKHIVLGHSHPECAYNDSLIQNFQNFSMSGESYFYTLPKVKNIVAQNPQLETIFLEFTNNQVSKNIEDWIWEEKYLSYYYAIYSPFIETSDKFRILLNKPAAFLKNLPIVFKDLLKKNISPVNYASEFGGYKRIDGTLENYEKTNQDSIIEDFVLINDETSQIHIEYLKRIIQYLGENNINVVLIRTPQHYSYQGFENEKQYQAILKSEFSDVNFIDFTKIPLTYDHFRDTEHLNREGARVTSNYLNKILSTDFSTFFGENKHVDYFNIIQID